MALTLGTALGTLLGSDDGAFEGEELGLELGAALGISLGSVDGALDGETLMDKLGTALGILLGSADGALDGTWLPADMLLMLTSPGGPMTVSPSLTLSTLSYSTSLDSITLLMLVASTGVSVTPELAAT